MDIMHTLTHSHCDSPLPIKDFGTLREILEKYPELFPAEEYKKTKVFRLL